MFLNIGKKMWFESEFFYNKKYYILFLNYLFLSNKIILEKFQSNYWCVSS